jgi:hypothetical protein
MTTVHGVCSVIHLTPAKNKNPTGSPLLDIGPLRQVIKTIIIRMLITERLRRLRCFAEAKQRVTCFGLFRLLLKQRTAVAASYRTLLEAKHGSSCFVRLLLEAKHGSSCFVPYASRSKAGPRAASAHSGAARSGRNGGVRFSNRYDFHFLSTPPYRTTTKLAENRVSVKLRSSF